MTDAKKTTAARLLADVIAAISHDSLSPVTDERGVYARLLGLGFGVECGRCGGLGSYGPLQVQGGVCFGCSGRCIVAPKLTRKLATRLQAEVTPEILAAYSAKLLAAKRARRAAKGAWDRCLAAYAASAWYLHCYAADKPAWSPLGRVIFAPGHAALDALKSTGDKSAEEILELERIALATYARCDAIYLATLHSGEVAASAREYAALKARAAAEGWRGGEEAAGIARIDRAAAERSAELHALAEWAAAVAA